MRAWIFPVSLDPADRLPLFVQIGRAITDDVSRGRLRPGDLLPGTRTLAATLGVHRSTVVAAYEELIAQGWVATRSGGGTVVAASPPEPRPRRFAGAGGPRPTSPGFDVAGFELVSRDAPGVPALGPHVLALWGGVPDVRLVPTAALGRAWRRAVRAGRTLL